LPVFGADSASIAIPLIRIATLVYDRLHPPLSPAEILFIPFMAIPSRSRSFLKSSLTTPFKYGTFKAWKG
jgi:hypothetical protein